MLRIKPFFSLDFFYIILFAILALTFSSSVLLADAHSYNIMAYNTTYDNNNNNNYYSSNTDSISNNRAANATNATANWYIKYKNNSQDYYKYFNENCMKSFNISSYYSFKDNLDTFDLKSNKLFNLFFSQQIDKKDHILQEYFDDIFLQQNKSTEANSFNNRVFYQVIAISPFAIFIIVNIVAILIGCCCACCDYCPIICICDKKYLMTIRYVPLLINIFCGLNCIIPVFFGFNSFK